MGLFFPSKVRIMAFDPEVTVPVIVGPIIVVDASLDEQHSLDVQVTSHPVPKGIALTDNIRAEPDYLRLVAFFTNTASSIDEVGTKLIGESAEQTYLRLADHARNGMVFRIETTLRPYENMVIKHLSAPRNVQRGTSVEATIEFVEIQKAESIETGFVSEGTAKKPLKAKDGKIKTQGPKPANQAPAQSTQSGSKMFNSVRASANAMGAVK